MKKYVWLLVFLIGMTANSYAFVDTFISTIYNNAKAAEETAFREWQKLEMVRQTKLLYDNYRDSVKFYNRMKVITDHKGGVGGYFSDEMKNRYDTLKDDTYYDFKGWLESDPDDPSAVRKFIDSTDKSIEKKLDYTEKIRDWGNKRDRQVITLADESKGKHTPEQNDSMLLKIGLLQLEILSSIDRNMRMSYSETVITAANSWKQEKKQLQKYIALQKELARRQNAKERKDVYDVLRQLPQ